MDISLQQAGELKQRLSDFVLDAEGELAIALETFSAAQLSRSQQQDMYRRSLIVDRFLIEGKVGDKTPIELFLEHEPDLSERDRALVTNWQHSFVGLFEITQTLDDGFELMNWTTAKRYSVKLTEPSASKAVERLKVGEILLTQIAPITDQDWMFFSPWTALGKLGKPKLAVAIGNFKQNYKSYLYSDAPELLAEAWRSVEQYYQDFIDFFGGDEVTLPGYQLGKKLTEFQEVMTQKQFEAAGFDRSKSLEELAEEAGVSKEEIVESAEAMGADQETVAQIFEKQGRSQKMAAPQVELPAHLKNAEHVTALTHPHWGQTFLPTYVQFKALLEAEDWQSAPNAEKLIRQYLENPEISSYVWHRLAQEYPIQLEAVLQDFLEQPRFNLTNDLDPLLEKFNKPLEAELPEIASVPIHLHNLFQDAVLEVSKDKSKAKSKKQKSGFGFQ